MSKLYWLATGLFCVVRAYAGSDLHHLLTGHPVLAGPE